MIHRFDEVDDDSQDDGGEEEPCLLPKALYVPEGPDHVGDRPPADGLEYLRGVIRESKKLDVVAVGEEVFSRIGSSDLKKNNIRTDVTPSSSSNLRRIFFATLSSVTVSENVAFHCSCQRQRVGRLRPPEPSGESALGLERPSATSAVVAIQGLARPPGGQIFRGQGQVGEALRRLGLSIGSRGISDDSCTLDAVQEKRKGSVRQILSNRIFSDPRIRTIRRSLTHFFLDLILEGWAQFCFGGSFWDRILAVREEKAVEAAGVIVGNNQLPVTSLLVQLRQVEIVDVLEFHIGWAESLEVVEEPQALWIYALLTRLEKPLHPDLIRWVLPLLTSPTLNDQSDFSPHF